VLKTYIIVDFLVSIDENLEEFQSFEDFLCVGYCKDYATALNTILTKKPELVFFHMSAEIPLSLLYELKEFTEHLPYVIVIHKDERIAYSAIKHNVSDFILFPIEEIELRKSLFKFNLLQQKKASEKLCVRSNGDYHFIPLNDIVYLQADNNTTDIHLATGKIISGFKTLKHYESLLPSSFFRIHNSYVVNLNYVSRINTGKSDCYLFDNTIKIPFSRTYKEQIELIIKRLR
jgi:DNA-binding LytR/AlgR family response regulator